MKGSTRFRSRPAASTCRAAMLAKAAAALVARMIPGDILPAPDRHVLFAGIGRSVIEAGLAAALAAMAIDDLAQFALRLERDRAAKA